MIMNKGQYDKEFGLASAMTDEFVVRAGVLSVVDPAHVAMFTGKTTLEDGAYEIPKKLKLKKDSILILEKNEKGDTILNVEGTERIKISICADNFTPPKVPTFSNDLPRCMIGGISVKEIVDYLNVAKKYTDHVRFISDSEHFTISYQSSFEEDNKGEKTFVSEWAEGYPCASRFPLDYLMDIFKAIKKVSEKVAIEIGNDMPVEIIGDDYRFLLAPRIEEDC